MKASIDRSRRKLLQSLGMAGSALFLSPWGCSREKQTTSSCLSPEGKAIRWIVPFPSGGGNDIYSRLLAPFYQRRLGVDIAVENIPGAAGIIGATTLKNSQPDGLTLGILNTPGLLVSSLTGEIGAPHPLQDFTILGRVVRNRYVWVTRAGSALQTVDDILSEARKRPLLFGVSEVSSNSFINIVLTTSLLGIQSEFIAGYAGSQDVSLAVARGEVDLTSATFEAILDRIVAHDLKPVLQIATERISPHPSLDDVKLLGSDQGVAVQRAIELGRDTALTTADVSNLIALVETGLMVAGPPHMDDTLSSCLEQKLYEALTDPEFERVAAKANRSLQVGRTNEAIADIRAATEQIPRFTPIVRDAVRKLRK